MKNKYLQLIFDTGVFAIGNFLVKFIQYFLLPLYTSVMSTEAYGTAELLNNFSEIVFPVITLAVYEAVFRFAVDRKQDKDALLYEGFLLIVKGFAVLFICISIIQHFIHYPYTYYVFFVLLAYSVRMLFANFARGSGYTKCFSLSGVVNAMALAVLSWFLLMCLHGGVEAYLFAIGCAHTVSALTLLFNSQIFRRLLRKKKDKLLLKSMLAYSLPLIPNNIAWWITSMSSRYVVLFACGSGIAGLYTAANKLPAVISVVSQVFQQAWQLSSSRECENEGYIVFYENVLKLYSAGMFIIGATAICATPILAKFTLKNSFYEARVYVPPMMLAILIQCISMYFSAILIAFKQTKVAMQGMILGGCVNIFLSIVLIRPLRIWGVLIAGILCYLSILVQRMWAVNKIVMLNKHFKINVPLFIILCAQTILMCFDNTIYTVISFVLWLFMLIMVCFSYRNDITYLLKKVL